MKKLHFNQRTKTRIKHKHKINITSIFRIIPNIRLEINLSQFRMIKQINLLVAYLYHREASLKKNLKSLYLIKHKATKVIACYSKAIRRIMILVNLPLEIKKLMMIGSKEILKRLD